MSQKEMRDIYHSSYLLRRLPGFPSCGEQQRRRTIQDILSSLMDRLHRQAYPTATRDPDLQEGGWVRPDQQESYEVALQVAHRGCWILPKPSRVTSGCLARSKGKDCRLVPTVEVEVGPELCSRSWSRTHSRGQSRNHAEPIVEVIPIVTYETYALGPLMNLHPGRE